MNDGTQAEGNPTPHAAKRAASAPLAADIGVVGALNLEVGHFVDGLANVRKYRSSSQTIIEGESQGKVVAVIVSGPGRANAKRATELLVEGHRPAWILSIGFAGALNPDLRRNDLVMPTEILDLQGSRLTVDLTLPESVSADRNLRLLTGRLLTLDSIATTTLEKQRLRQEYDADLVDMESSTVAQICAERSIKFLGIRVISDEAQHDLPPEVVDLLTRSGSYLVGSALRSIWNRPSSLKDFWNLHLGAQETPDRLASFTHSAIIKLV